jgi:hypothetical protein
MASKKQYLTEETEWIVESGEIPEVAFHEAVFYLTKSKKGPALKLTSADIKLLEKAVINRYKTIILRDLNCKNIGTPVFRGIKRSIINYKRLKKYQAQKNIKNNNLKKEIIRLLTEYMDQECREISENRFYRTINCTRRELEAFTEEVGADIDPAWMDLCFKQIPLTFDEVYRVRRITEKHDYPYKLLFEGENYLEIAVFNKNRLKFPISLKMDIDETREKKQDTRLKADAVFRSISKSKPPWNIK